jgi:hypothetical protein
MLGSFGIDSLITAAADLFTSKTRGGDCVMGSSLDKVYTIPDMKYR